MESKYWDKEVWFYKNTKKLNKLCLGCGEELNDKVQKSLGMCNDCKLEYHPFNDDFDWDLFIIKRKNKFIKEIKNYKIK